VIGKRAVLLLLSTILVQFPVLLSFNSQLNSANDRLFAAAQTDAPGSNILIESISTRYDQDMAAFHIFGEVTNNLKRPVENIKLNVTFFNSNATAIGNITGYPYLNFLKPQEKSAFDVVAYGNNATKLLNFSYYKISRSWDEIQQPKEGLVRLDVRSMSRDPCGYYHIEGIVTNVGKNTTQGIGLSAAFYNANKQVVASAFTTIDDSLDPTKHTSFSFVIEKEVLPHFAYYSLNVQSIQYSSFIPMDEEEEIESNFQVSSTLPAGRPGMVLSTGETTYNVTTSQIAVFGMISSFSNTDQERSGLVLIRIVTPSGLVPYLVTAPVSERGAFSRSIDFPADESYQGQVYRVRAEYEGMAAETTFSFAHKPGNDTGSDSRPDCEDRKDVSISQIGVGPTAGVSGNVTDLLSGKEIEVGSAVQLSAVAENNLSRPELIVVIFEVFDSQGRAVFIQVGNSLLGPNGVQEAMTSWTPDQTGRFTIKSFAISNLDQPTILSTAAPLSVNVVEGNGTFNPSP
jgi:hypothetical protein